MRSTVAVESRYGESNADKGALMQKLTVSISLLAAFMLGCTPVSNPEDQGTKSSEVVEEEEQEEEEEQQPEGADGTCANPFMLYADGASASAPTAASALTGSCGGVGSEAVYQFTLDEESGVNIQVGGVDAVIYLLKDSCDASNEVEGSCKDAQGTSGVEEINMGMLTAGTYFLVVDTYEAGTQGTYLIDWEVTSGGFCANDDYEPNEDVTTAVGLGSADLDLNAYASGPDAEPQLIQFEICEGDVDMFSFGHFGGNLTLAHTMVESLGTVSGEIYGQNLTGDEENGFTAELGEKVGDLPYDGDLARGNYYVKMTGTLEQANNGPNYSIAISHACVGDSLDTVDPETDDSVLANTGVSLLNVLNTPVERKICADDQDTAILTNVVAGTIVVTLAGGATLNATVQSIGEENALNTYSATTAVSGDDLTVTLTDAPAGRYLLTVSVANTPETLDYSLNATFAGIASGPSNDTCEDAQTFVFSNNTASFVGHNINAADDAEAPMLTSTDSEGAEQTYSCNGADDAATALAAAEEAGEAGLGTPKDVFYYLSLTEATDFELEYDGVDSGFAAAVYMMETDGTCPADLSTLTYVNNDAGEVLCSVGSYNRVRLNEMAAGDYLIVVDGVYYAAGFFNPEMLTEGGFSLNAKTYPDGFPPIQSCLDATAQALPASGESLEITVNYEDGDSWIDSYADCGTYADRARGGKEQIFTMTPSSDVTLSVKAEGDYDTVVAIREANTDEEGAFQCEKGTQVTCNDDGEGVSNYGSLIESVSLTSGKTYYLVVDAFSSSSTGSVTVTLTAE